METDRSFQKAFQSCNLTDWEITGVRDACRMAEPSTVDALKAKAKTMKADKEVLIGYDKFKDESMILSKPRNIVGSWEGGLSIVASGGLYGGRARCAKLVFCQIVPSTRSIRNYGHTRFN